MSLNVKNYVYTAKSIAVPRINISLNTITSDELEIAKIEHLEDVDEYFDNVKPLVEQKEYILDRFKKDALVEVARAARRVVGHGYLALLPGFHGAFGPRGGGAPAAGLHPGDDKGGVALVFEHEVVRHAPVGLLDGAEVVRLVFKGDDGLRPHQHRQQGGRSQDEQFLHHLSVSDLGITSPRMMRRLVPRLGLLVVTEMLLANLPGRLVGSKVIST